jgi:hypothetical protein
MVAAIFVSLLTLLAAVNMPGVPTLTQAPQPIGSADAAVAKRAKDLITQIQSGKVDRTLLTPTFSEEFTDDAIAGDATFLGGRGKPTSFGLLQRTDAGDDVRYVFLAGWSDGNVAYTFGIDKKTGLIDALYFRAAGNPQN